MVVLVINPGQAGEVFNLKSEHGDFYRDVLYIKGIKTDEDREVPLNCVSRGLQSKLVSKAQEQGGNYLYYQPAHQDQVYDRQNGLALRLSKGSNQ